jgi:hypothetical protein
MNNFEHNGNLLSSCWLRSRRRDHRKNGKTSRKSRFVAAFQALRLLRLLEEIAQPGDFNDVLSHLLLAENMLPVSGNFFRYCRIRPLADSKQAAQTRKTRLEGRAIASIYSGE